MEAAEIGEPSAGDGVGEDGAFNGLFVLDLPDVCSKGDKVAGASRKVAEVGGVVEEGGKGLRIQAEGSSLDGGAEMEGRRAAVLLLLLVSWLLFAPVIEERCGVRIKVEICVPVLCFV